MSSAAQHDYQDPERYRELLQDRRERATRFYATLLELTPRTYVTPLLIAANVLHFACLTASLWIAPRGDIYVQWGANYGPQTVSQGEWWRLFTCMFVHIGILHLAVNMWVLWDIGRFMERLLGNAGFVLLYVASGLCGSLASLFWNPHSVSAGASGAIFGLFGGLLGFLVLGRSSMPIELVTRFRSSALTLLGFNLVFGLLMPGVDNAAHLGGLLGGCLCGLLMGQPITPDSARRRWLRNLLVLPTASAFVLAVAALLPKPLDTHQIVEEFNDVHADSQVAYLQARQDAGGGKLTSEQFAELIEQELIPPSQTLRERMQNLSNVPQSFRPLFAACIEVLRTREDAWRQEAALLRDPSPERERAYAEKAQARDAALAALQKIDKGLQSP